MYRCFGDRLPFWLALLLVMLIAAPLRAEEPPAAFDAAAFVRNIREPAPAPKIEVLQRWERPTVRRDPAALSFSGDGTRLGVLDMSGAVVVRDTKSGEVVSAPDAKGAHYAGVFVLSKTGKYYVTAAPEDTYILVETATGKAVNKYDGLKGRQTIIITADDKHLVAVDGNGGYQRFPLLSGKGTVHPPHNGTIGVPAISPTGKHFSIQRDWTLQVWEVNDQGQAQLKSTLNLPRIVHRTVMDDIQIVFAKDYQLAMLPLDHGLESYNGYSYCNFDHDWCRMTVDGTYTVFASKSGGLSVYLQTDIYRERAYALQEEITHFDLANDGHTIAVAAAKDGAVTVRKLPAMTSQPIVHFHRDIARLLHEHQFDALEAIGAIFEQEGQPLPWNENIGSYESLLLSLLNYPDDPELLKKHRAALNAWAKAHPDASLIRVLRAKHSIHKAWEARGGGYANTVPPEAWQEFHKHIGDAHKVLQPLIDSETTPIGAFPTIATIALAESWPEEECRPLIEKMKKLAPKHFDAYTAMAQKYMTRWGGEPGDLAKFAKEVADNLGGDEGDALYARIAWAQYGMYPPPTFFEQTKLSSFRACKGTMQLFKTAPDGNAAVLMGTWWGKYEETEFEWSCRELLKEDIHLAWPAMLYKRGLYPHQLKWKHGMLPN